MFDCAVVIWIVFAVLRLLDTEHAYWMLDTDSLHTHIHTRAGDDCYSKFLSRREFERKSYQDSAHAVGVQSEGWEHAWVGGEECGDEDEDTRGEGDERGQNAHAFSV